MLELNPIDVLKKRQMNFLPTHFSKIKLDRSMYEPDIDKWIRNKLKGRYFIGNISDVDKYNKLKIFTSIAFEDHKELTYFMLACPFYRR